MIIKIENLVKEYSGKTKVLAVNNLSFEVRPGEIFGLLGPNGCGKSTTINCILQLLKYNSGDIYLFDKKMSVSSQDIKRRIGYVPQDVAVSDELTVEENIAYFCSLYIKDKETIKKYTEDALDFVSIKEFRKFRPKKLSGGLLRRLNIACGIVHKPELIFFDEPTVAVDPQSRNKILENIKELNKNGATIVYTTHYMEEVEQLCNYICILDKGNVIASGSKDKIKQNSNLGQKITIKVDLKAQELLKTKDYIDSIEIVDKKLVLKTNKKEGVLKDLLDTLENNDMEIQEIYQEQPTLNDVFLELTGKELRD